MKTVITVNQTDIDSKNAPRGVKNAVEAAGYNGADELLIGAGARGMRLMESFIDQADLLTGEV